jgi:hypothetical protein
MNIPKAGSNLKQQKGNKLWEEFMVLYSRLSTKWIKNEARRAGEKRENRESA